MGLGVSSVPVPCGRDVAGVVAAVITVRRSRCFGSLPTVGPDCFQYSHKNILVRTIG